MAAEGDGLVPTTYLISAGPAAVATPYRSLVGHVRTALDDLGMRREAAAR